MEVHYSLLPAAAAAVVVVLLEAAFALSAVHSAVVPVDLPVPHKGT